MDILRGLGLGFDRSLVIMNYFNKQLPDMTRVSQVNSYARGQRSKFPHVRFVMLHYQDGIDKESMSVEDLEDYIQQLPRKEQKSFDQHISRMEQDEALDPELADAFGVRRAISHVQSILMDWMRANSRDVLSSRQDVTRHEHNLNQLEDMLEANNADKIKDAWRNSTVFS